MMLRKILIVFAVQQQVVTGRSSASIGQSFPAATGATWKPQVSSEKIYLTRNHKLPPNCVGAACEKARAAAATVKGTVNTVGKTAGTLLRAAGETFAPDHTKIFDEYKDAYGKMYDAGRTWEGLRRAKGIAWKGYEGTKSTIGIARTKSEIARAAEKLHQMDADQKDKIGEKESGCFAELPRDLKKLLMRGKYQECDQNLRAELERKYALEMKSVQTAHQEQVEILQKNNDDEIEHYCAQIAIKDSQLQNCKRDHEKEIQQLQTQTLGIEQENARELQAWKDAHAEIEAHTTAMQQSFSRELQAYQDAHAAELEAHTTAMQQCRADHAAEMEKCERGFRADLANTQQLLSEEKSKNAMVARKQDSEAQVEQDIREREDLIKQLLQQLLATQEVNSVKLLQKKSSLETALGEAEKEYENDLKMAKAHWMNSLQEEVILEKELQPKIEEERRDVPYMWQDSDGVMTFTKSRYQRERWSEIESLENKLTALKGKTSQQKELLQQKFQQKLDAFADIYDNYKKKMVEDIRNQVNLPIIPS